MLLPPITLTGSLQNPAFSPDGKSLAFTRFRNGYNVAPADVYVIDLATDILTTIVEDGADNVSEPGAAWHPSGGLVFSSDRNGVHDEIWSWHAGALTQLTSRADFVAWEPSWAPDGQSIVFESHPDKDGDTPGQIVAHNIGTDKYVPLTNVTRDCRQPNWSPDGRAIVFQEQLSGDRWNVVVYDIASATEHIIAAGTDATWSPDSARILFSDNDGHLATVSIAGGIALKVTGSPSGYQGAPSFSPDGKYICCEASASDPDGGPGTHLLLIPVENAPGLSLPPQPNVTSMSDAVPAHLALARSLIGKVADGPSILPLAAKIGQLYPDMAAYCRLVTPTTSWCGLFAGYTMAMTGIRPPYNPKVDVESFLWARAWLLFGTPVSAGAEQLGDILVFDFGGGDSHVTQYNGASGSNYLCLGGNQSDAANVTAFAKTKCIGRRRPPADGAAVQPPLSTAPPAPDPTLATELQTGAVGDAVTQLQTLLGVAVDGEFGPDTQAAVEVYQASHGLEVDGVVGDLTWAALLGHAPVAPVMGASAGALSADAVAKIIALARVSPARTGWSNGSMPVGCINGLAVSYGMAYRDLKAGTSAALAMARPLGAASDALVLYGDKVNDPVSLLRADFELLFGSAMRESSGNYSEGVDTNAGVGRAPEEIEAGLFQQSYNSFAASRSPELPKLLAQWRTSNDDGLLSIFREGVTPKQTQNFGSGDALLFQQLCKTKPLFAVYCAAIGQRILDSHWGPISRHEAQMRPEVDALLQQVQAIVDAIPAPVVPPVKPPINGQVLHPGDPIASHPPASPFVNPVLLAGIAALFFNLTGQTQMTNTTAGQGLDLSKLLADLPKFLAILQDPILQRLLSDQPVKLSELKTLPPEFLSLLTGKAPALQLTPPIAAPPVVPADPATPAATPSAPVIAAAPASSLTKNIGTGVLGVLGAAVTWFLGGMGDTSAVLTGAASVAAAATGLPAPVINGFLSLLKPAAAKLASKLT